jgi:acyl-CoA synthetase (AMP-forming)/AMP-acid ligase II
MFLREASFFIYAAPRGRRSRQDLLSSSRKSTAFQHTEGRSPNSMKFPNIFTLFARKPRSTKTNGLLHARKRRLGIPNLERLRKQSSRRCVCVSRKGPDARASVAILAGNIPEWSVVDIASIAAGGVGVGIYPTSSAEQVDFIIRHSDSEFVIVDTIAQRAKITEFENVKEIFCIEDGTFATFLEFGRERRKEYLHQVEEIALNADPRTSRSWSTHRARRRAERRDAVTSLHTQLG